MRAVSWVEFYTRPNMARRWRALDLARARRNLQIKHAAHHGHAASSDPHSGNVSVLFLGARLEQARAAHLNSLRDAQVEFQIRLRTQAREKARQRGIAAAGSRVFRDAIERREHAHLDVGIVVLLANVQEDTGNTI